MTPEKTDDLILRYLGSNLQSATIWLVAVTLGAAAILAIIVKVIG